MNDQERDEMLVSINDRTIRLEERQIALHAWSLEHKEEHKTYRANLQKWLGIIVTSLVGIITKLFFWA